MKTFRFTDRYIRKKKIQRYTTLILFPILLVLSFLVTGMFFWESVFAKLSCVIFMLTLVFLLMIYGMNRIYGDDIRIENNQIVYYVSYEGSRGCLWSHFVFALIEKVEVKRNKIIIHGHIIEERRYGHVFKKMALPKEIENVDEFIRIAQSMVV